MKVKDHLNKEQLKKLNQIKKTEKLSERELHDLMGINRDTYKRNRGAIRRK